MDPTTDIKARLSIEDLVGQYCQIQKKGRNFVCICPFHKDTHPSMVISPDKGIAYCFACQSGGDIFSFYQAIEGVDFRQALKDLAEKAGVTLESAPVSSMKKDEKDRYRECLEAAASFYQSQLKESKSATEYISIKRKVPDEQVAQFELGFAPDSFSATYDYLLKQGFSRSEILGAGIGVQKDLHEEKIYDRFRNRLMFPIRDQQGKLVGFGGRTLGDSDAKYINSAEGPLYHKSNVLYGIHLAKESFRESKAALLVEGYFDVLACHRVGVHHTVAVSGTALTPQHAKLLKRYVEVVVLCLDQDKAGRDAAERAFHVCTEEGLQVSAIVLPAKDPDETLQSSEDLLKSLLSSSAKPYLDVILDEIQKSDVSSFEGKRVALKKIMPLLRSLTSEVERTHYMSALAALLGTTELALQEDLKHVDRPLSHEVISSKEGSTTSKVKKEEFSRQEIALGFFLVHPALKHLISQLIEPESGFASALYQAIKDVSDVSELSVDMLNLPQEFQERAGVLHLFCEHHGFAALSPVMAEREIRKNCLYANRDMLHAKQKDISRKLIEARSQGNVADEATLNTQYQEILKLASLLR